MIKKYISGLEKETSSQQYKPFFTIYTKRRSWFNPLKYIFGEFKFKWFEINKQPNGYENAFEFYANSIKFDSKDKDNVEVDENGKIITKRKP
ncbi:MAG: hypothetical protein WDA47_04190 [Bacilli bacterium]|jgi:hypothetical protein